MEKTYNITSPDGSLHAGLTLEQAETRFGKSNANALLITASIDQSLSVISAMQNDIMETLTGFPSRAEVASWSYKLDAAKAYLAEGADDAQKAIIELEAADTPDESPQQRAQKIVARAQAYMGLIGVSSAFRERHRSAVKAAKTLDEVEAAVQAAQVDMQAILASAK